MSTFAMLEVLVVVVGLAVAVFGAWDTVRSRERSRQQRKSGD